jgi:hypothetical protein
MLVMAMSNSALALHRFLEEKTPEAKAVRDKYHYTALWRYRTGQRKPGVEIAADLERMTNGRVPANGWENLPDADLQSHPPEAG